MTLLLADDEFHVRKKLLTKIDWELLGIDLVLEAENGEAGCELACCNKIDLLITDIRMPRIDGIELASRIRKLYPDCAILFLSGYSDKEYLRSAITLHALHYIDKPILLTQVVDAVKEAVAYCHNLQNSTVFAREIRELQLVRQLCLPKPDLSEMESLLESCDLTRFHFSDSRTLLVQLYTKQPLADGICGQLRDLTESSRLTCILGDYQENLLVIHLLSGVDHLVSDLSEHALSSLLRRITYLLKGVSCFLSVGILAQNIEEVYLSYQSAVISLQQNFFLGPNSISFAEHILPDAYVPDESFKRNLLDHVIHGDKDACFSLLDSLFESYRKHPGSLVSLVRENYYAILSELFQHCLSHHIHFQSASSKQLWDTISCAYTLKDLHNITVRLYQAYFDYLAKNEETLTVSGSIRKLIEDSYQDPALGLPFISDRLHLSQSYISQIFKQETGITINQYLTTYRIDRASSLLLKSDLKISEIAVGCGFSDQNYFTKLFKKYTGKTPSEFRGYF